MYICIPFLCHKGVIGSIYLHSLKINLVQYFLHLVCVYVLMNVLTLLSIKYSVTRHGFPIPLRITYKPTGAFLDKIRDVLHFGSKAETVLQSGHNT